MVAEGVKEEGGAKIILKEKLKTHEEKEIVRNYLTHLIYINYEFICCVLV